MFTATHCTNINKLFLKIMILNFVNFKTMPKLNVINKNNQ